MTDTKPQMLTVNAVQLITLAVPTYVPAATEVMLLLPSAHTCNHENIHFHREIKMTNLLRTGPTLSHSLQRYINTVGRRQLKLEAIHYT